MRTKSMLITVVCCIAIALSLILVHAEEAEKNPVKPIRPHTLREYGNYFTVPLPPDSEATSPSYLALPLENFFHYDLTNIAKNFLPENLPFTSSHKDIKKDQEAFKMKWMSVQLTQLATKGWKLISASDGEFFFERVKIVEKESVNREKIQYTAKATAFFPDMPKGISQGALLIPPLAYSIRVYSRMPIVRETTQFFHPAILRDADKKSYVPKETNLPFNSNDFNDRLCRIVYENTEHTVIRIDFNRTKAHLSRFWDWQDIVVHFPLIPLTEPMEDFTDSPLFAWEFLDYSGNPLPPNAITTSFFPKDSEDFFRLQRKY